MAMLTGPQIEKAIKAGHIYIGPYTRENIQPNSVDLTLSGNLLVYPKYSGFFDMRDRSWNRQSCEETPLTHNLWESGGFLLKPGDFVLGATIERVRCDRYVPMINGKSSLARMGMSIHQTGGFADVGWDGEFTLEITTTVPVVLRGGLPVCQVCFFETIGEIRPYSGRYLHQEGPTPTRA